MLISTSVYNENPDLLLQIYSWIYNQLQNLSPRSKAYIYQYLIFSLFFLLRNLEAFPQNQYLKFIPRYCRLFDFV